MSLHHPVLLQSVVDALNLAPGSIYVDATYGRGGHAQQVMALHPDLAQAWWFDRDPEAIAHAEKEKSSRVHVIHDSFANLNRYLAAESVDAVLFDLGVSSPQLDTPERGFSFRFSSDLDMRFDPNQGEPVHAWLNRAAEQEIADVLFWYGEERMARKIARAIVQKREEAPWRAASSLAEMIAAMFPAKPGSIHPATRTFQALRLYVNQELEHLESGFLAAAEILKPQGRLVVISFQGIETRMLKAMMRHEPMLEKGKTTSSVFRVIKKRVPDAWEQRVNPRARSAQMMVLEKKA